MAKSTAPILGIAGVVILSDVLAGGSIQEKSYPAIVAAGFAAGAFALLEKINQPLVVGVAWIALITTVMTYKNPTYGATLLDRLEGLPHQWRGETSWTRYQDS